MPSVTAVELAASSLTLIAAGEPAVRTGTSFTALTVIESVSVSVSTPPKLVPPLSCDSHMHIYDPAYPLAATAGAAAPPGLLRDYLKVRARLGIAEPPEGAR